MPAWIYGIIVVFAFTAISAIIRFRRQSRP